MGSVPNPAQKVVQTWWHLHPSHRGAAIHLIEDILMDPVSLTISKRRVTIERERRRTQAPDSRPNKGVSHFKADPFRKWVYIQVKDSVMGTLIPDYVSRPLHECVAYLKDHAKTGGEVCLFTYAKAYYRGGGWWLISGYSSDGSDVAEVLQCLNLL